MRGLHTYCVRASFCGLLGSGFRKNVGFSLPNYVYFWSYGVCHRVDSYVVTCFSDDPAASIIMVETRSHALLF
jgi:hypothetical protein